MKGALGMEHLAFLSEEAQCRGTLRRVPLLGTLEGTLRKALGMGISQYFKFIINVTDNLIIFMI